MIWYLLGVISALLIALSAIIFKYKLNPSKRETMTCACLLIVGLGLFGLLYLIFFLGTDNLTRVTSNTYKYVFLSALLLFGGYIFWYSALRDVGNPVLLWVVYEGAKIIFISVIAYLFFDSKLSFQHIIAILLILLGIKMLI